MRVMWSGKVPLLSRWVQAIWKRAVGQCHARILHSVNRNFSDSVNSRPNSQTLTAPMRYGLTGMIGMMQ